MGELETRQFLSVSETLLPFAKGDSLDLIGQIFGVTRIQQADASVAAADGNFTFYVRRGTFGDLNRGQSIASPADVRISTGDTAGPVFLTNPVTLASGASRQAFSARALNPGTGGNAPSGVFNRHNFTAYAEASFGSLLVTNNFGIIGGRDTEDDESYRYRIHLKIQSQSGINEAALRYEPLQLPGI